MQQRTEKVFFEFEIIAFELVALDTPFIWDISSERNHLWGSSFFSKYWKLYVYFGNAGKNGENFFWFEIIAFDLMTLDTRFYWEKILVIGCQYVDKMCQDFKYY